ncbi:MAG: GRAS family protein [Saprospiraceae bacterium]
MTATATIDVYKSLQDIMRLDQVDFNEQTKSEIEELFSYCMEGMETDSQKLLATLLIKALNKRICSEFIGENIYLNRYETSQIQLFNILIEKFPFVKYSQMITNQAIVDIISQHPDVTLIDIGIGQGTQIMNILEGVATMRHLKKLNIIGIEPYGDALQQAETNIMAYRERVPFDIEFTGICDSAENVNFESIGNLSGTVVVNASLALHHIQSDRNRRQTIASIRKINPAAFILIEPNVNHYEPDFYSRFVNCYNHFYSIFQVIDQIDIEQKDKNALKLFFGREIEDIIGKDEKDRYEKHEPATHWIEKLTEQQFSIKNECLVSPVSSAGSVKIQHHQEGFLGFTFDKETVLAVIYAN